MRRLQGEGKMLWVEVIKLYRYRVKVNRHKVEVISNTEVNWYRTGA